MRRVLIAVASVALIAGGVTGGFALATGATTTGQDVTCHIDDTNVLSCPLPPPSTVTETTTETTTETATETQTVPGPTTTETVTVTATPPTPTPTITPSPPPPPGSFAPGQDMHASNTGYAGDGLTAADLTSQGAITYGSAFNGQTITRKAYTGHVSITGSNITIKDCSLTVSGTNAFGFDIYGTGNRVDHCTITSPAGGEAYEPVFIEPSSIGAQVTYDDISRGENLITTYGNNACTSATPPAACVGAAPVTITNNYLHDSCGCGDPDGIELYGGSNVSIVNNRINYDGAYEAPINIAPYGSYKVQGVTIRGNFLDHGQAMMLIDNQNTSCPGATGNCLVNVKIVGNAMGGHSNPAYLGIYAALENYENRPFVQDDAGLAGNINAIEWPTTGTPVNEWQETGSLSPNRTGQTVLPTCPSPC